jgi:hypothetical protein
MLSALPHARALRACGGVIGGGASRIPCSTDKIPCSPAKKSLFRREQGMLFKLLKTQGNYEPKTHQKRRFPVNSL